MTTRGKAAEANAPQESALLDEARQQGLEPISGDVMPFGVAPLPAGSEYGDYKRVADLIPTPSQWAEYGQVDIDELVNRDLIVRDVMFFPSTLPGQDEWYIILMSDPGSGETFTTASGSGIVGRKLHTLKEFKVNGEYRNMLPIVGRITKTPSRTKGYSDYYDLI